MGEAAMRKRQIEALVDFAERALQARFAPPSAQPGIQCRAALMNEGATLALAVRHPESERMDGLQVGLPPAVWFGQGIQARVTRAVEELYGRWTE